MNEVLNALSLAQKAGMVKTGSDTVLTEIKQGHAKLVIVAGDASDHTKKTFLNKCSFYHVDVQILADKDSLSRALGKEQRTVVCILSDGFKDLLLKKIGELK